jgi:hypothetical protein
MIHVLNSTIPVTSSNQNDSVTGLNKTDSGNNLTHTNSTDFDTNDTDTNLTIDLNETVCKDGITLMNGTCLLICPDGFV